MTRRIDDRIQYTDKGQFRYTVTGTRIRIKCARYRDAKKFQCAANRRTDK